MAKTDGLTYAKATDWQGEITSERINGGPNHPEKPIGAAGSQAADGRVWVRTSYFISRWRIAQGVVGYDPEIGLFRAGTFIKIVNGGNNLAGRSDHAYVCIGDDLQPDPPGSGFSRQVQEWRHNEEWEEAAVSVAP